MHIIYLIKKAGGSLLLACTFHIVCQAQKPSSLFQLTHQTQIEEIQIKDTALLRIIKQFVVDTKATDTAFRQYGCLAIYLQWPVDNTRTYDYQIHLNRYYFALWPEDPDYQFPPYYSYCDDKLVLVFPVKENGMIDYQFSQKSKKKLSKIVNRQVEEPLVTYAFNEKGVKMKLKSTGGWVHGGGLDICYKNGQIVAVNKPH